MKSRGLPAWSLGLKGAAMGDTPGREGGATGEWGRSSLSLRLPSHHPLNSCLCTSCLASPLLPQTEGGRGGGRPEGCAEGSLLVGAMNPQQ